MSIAEKILRAKADLDAVYEAGKAQGGGSDSYYDTFWDNYQDYGTRTDYTNGFGSCWTKETFKPKYDIKPTNAYMFLRYAPLENIDLVEHLEKLGVTLDFSNCTNCQYGFYGAKISRLGVIDLRKIKGATADGVFSSAYLKTIDLLKVSEEQTNLSWFSEATVLENITIEGVIAANLNMSKSSLLTPKSLMSIINALKDFAEQKTLTYPNGSYESWNSNGFPNVQDPRGFTWDVTSASISGTTLTVNCANDNDEGIITVYGIDISADDVNNMKTFRLEMLDGGESVNAIIITTAKEVTSKKTLTLHADAKARLSADELKIATDKGWNVV